MKVFSLLVITYFFSSIAHSADYPTSFSNAKKKAEREVYFDHLTTFYCQCDYVFDDTEDRDNDGNIHETMIHPEACGYSPRKPVTKSNKPNSRVSRIEWEHIMPAHIFGGELDEWKNNINYPECKNSKGKQLNGRDCAYKLNTTFKRAHDDLNNLAPAVGELNGDRSNYQFAVISGEERNYGSCDFEVDTANKVAEPSDQVKGDVARTYLYMIEEHGAVVSSDVLATMLHWHLLDPVTEWECIRDKRIRESQGMGNHYVSDSCD